MGIVVRVFLVYVFILLGMRIIGKREFSQLSPAELVTLLIIPELVSQPLSRDDYSMTNALIAVCTLFTLVVLTSVLAHLSEKAEKKISGVPTVLVHNGKFIEDNLNKERVGPEEIYAHFHQVGLEEISQVKWAILETDGKISIIPYPSQGPRHHKQEEKDVIN